MGPNKAAAAGAARPGSGVGMGMGARAVAGTKPVGNGMAGAVGGNSGTVPLAGAQAPPCKNSGGCGCWKGSWAVACAM